MDSCEVAKLSDGSEVGWVAAYGETQHPTPLSRVFGIQKIAGFYVRSTQPTGLEGFATAEAPTCERLKRGCDQVYHGFVQKTTN
jgi:hypothetical protein